MAFGATTSVIGTPIGGTPTPKRGTTHFDPNTGYAGSQFSDPNTWATDADYNAYMSSLSQPKPLASVAGLNSATGYTPNPQPSFESPYAPNPGLITNQYQTGNAGGPAVNGTGSITLPAYEQQQQTQLESRLGSDAAKQQAELGSTAALQRAGFDTAAAQQQAGYNTSAAAAQAGYQSEADARRAALDAEAAKQQAGYQSTAAQQAAATQSDADRRRAQLQAEAEQRRLGYIKTLTSNQSPMVGPQGGPAGDENAARAAAFGRAKEQAGQTALASLKSLQDVMASSGLTGSSVEAQGIQNVIGGGAGAVNNFTRTQLIQDLNRAAEIADQNQQNAITQRGQNMSQIPSLVSLLSATGGAY